MQSFLDVLQYLLWSIFCLINFLIIKKDLQEKIIPNKYLVFLIFLSIPMLLFIGGSDFSIFLFFISLLLTFLVSFALYYYGIWSAGDAKYLLVLSLFVPHVGIEIFVSNIIIVTIIYLCIYFVFLIVGKGILFDKKEEAFSHRILNSIWEEQIYPKLIFLKTPTITGIVKIINSINIFLTIFVLIRLSRVLILDTIIAYSSQDFQDRYIVYIILGMILIMIGFMIGVRILWGKIVIHISKKYGYTNLNINMFASNILFIFAGIFIYFDYAYNPEKLIKNMKEILTFYIAIFICFKCIIYLYKFTFIEMEKRPIKISKLKSGDIIYKKFITDTFLPLLDKTNTGKDLQKEKEIIQNIKNKINKREVKALKKVYKSFSKDSNIAIIETFAFSPYIFLGFIATLLWGNSPVNYVLKKIVSIL